MLHWLIRQIAPALEAIGLGWMANAFAQTEFRTLLAAGSAFLIVLLLGRPTVAWLIRMKIGDAGLTDGAALRQHAANKANTPTMGGILICGAILFCSAMLCDVFESFYARLGLIVVLWLCLLGGADDWLKLTAARRGGGRQGLHAWEKLVFQLGIGVLVGIFAYRAGLEDGQPGLAHVMNWPWQAVWDPVNRGVADDLGYLPRLVYVLVATLLITGMSNAVNITDGMDGLASGISAAVAFGLVLLTLIAGDRAQAQAWMVPHVQSSGELAVLAAATGGACLGFLWWNCHPARVFMGDTGSLALGGIIAYIALVVRQEIVVLLMCGVFLLEIGSVVIQVGYFRFTGGRRVFRMAPYHHHLHLGGWQESQVVQRLWILSILLLIIAIAVVRGAVP